MVLLKLADYDVEWKHLYVASFTIDMVNCYARKLLSVGIPLSHALCFPDLLLYVTLQRSCSCTERSVCGVLPYVPDPYPYHVFASVLG